MCTRAKAKPAENGTADQAEHLRTHRVGNIRHPVEFLLHLLQDVCGGAVLGFAVVELIQNSVENLPTRKDWEFSQIWALLIVGDIGDVCED